MTGPRNLPHVLITTPATALSYRSYGPGGGPRKPPAPPDRAAHGAMLRVSMTSIKTAALARRAAAAANDPQVTASGIMVQFESVPGVPLKVESLEHRKGRVHTEVVALSEVKSPDGSVIQRATVFVPDDSVQNFLTKFEAYESTPDPLAQASDTKVHRHHDAFDRIAALRAATLNALWTDDATTFPTGEEPVWWEVWLRRPAAGAGAEIAEFRAFAERAGLTVSHRALAFVDRSILLVHGPAAALSSSIDILASITEVRGARPAAAGLDRLNAFEQAEYANEIRGRIVRRSGDQPAVCVIDTGVNRGHPLLFADLDDADLHTVDPNWLASDHQGHGTEMAGLSLLGDLTPHLLDTTGALIDVAHRLESVKILPPPWARPHSPQVYGAVTAAAIALPEIQAPTRRRVFSMAITASPADGRGRPTSWSAAIDALAAGRSFDATEEALVYVDDDVPTSRLIVLSGGNVDEPVPNHLDNSDTTPLQDPAQAWNALTVGAHTEYARLLDAGWPGGRALAPLGELSPWSTTAMMFDKSLPLKPDVVYEGSNVVLTSTGEIDTGPAPSLNVVTTSWKPQERLFELSSGTSAATAQVARLGARILAQSPTLWPETVRALIVHSARWTPQMVLSMPTRTKAERQRLIRRYGWGVPDEARALYSARDALTLIHEGTIRPFAKGKANEMHLHHLPWPGDALAGLRDARIQLRVTLSYFIEPNPARRGLTSRFCYESHGLSFEFKKSTETEAEYRKRLNKQDLEEGEKVDRTGDRAEWFLGNTRSSGSLRSDMWTGTAADLAERGVLAIVPEGGWWRDLPSRDRSSRGARYALVVSIESEEVDVDLWTPVTNALAIST